MSLRLDAARRALDPIVSPDLRDFGVAALAFKVAIPGDIPVVAAHAVDEEGDEHWLAVRSAPHGVTAAYLQILAELLKRGLHVRCPVLVDADGCAPLARSIDRALGPVVHAPAVHAGTPRAAS